MSSTTPLPRTGLRTRDKESQRHPGKPDQPRTKRSTQEVQAEKAEKARVQSERERLHAETIQATAELETRMEAQLKKKLVTAHHPPPSTQKKMPRALSHAKALDVLPEVVPRARPDNRTRTPETEDVVLRGSGDASGDEYDPLEEGGPADDEDEESVLDKSSDEDSNRSQRKVTKPGHGRQLRTAVHSAQGKNMPEGGTNAKRKANQNQEEFNAGHKHTQKKARKSKVGLYDDWAERTHVGSTDDEPWQMQGVTRTVVSSNGYSRSASSGVSFTSSSRPPTQPTSEDDHEGGITDDTGEREEHTKLSGKAMHPEALKNFYYGGGSKATETGIQSFARVVPTTSVPTFVKPSASSHAAIAHMRRKKGDIRLSDLPTHIQNQFTDKFAPRLYELFGSLSAWEQPTNTDIQRLWKKVFPREQSLDFGKSEGTVVHKLIEDRLSQWRKKFGEHGLEALEEITFNDLPKNDSAHREWWCHWALSGDDDSCQPFYYSTYEEPDSEVEGSQLKAKGIFQSPLIATIFGTHVAWLSVIEECDRSDKKPIGALVHSIQAAKRAISWWETGDVVKPKKPLNEYSKANWGDHIETREGRTIHISSTSDLVAIVSKLKDRQWEKIFAAARASGKRRSLKRAVVAIDTPLELSRVAGVELRDDDSDLADE